jgi:hypothetical protein
MKKHALFVMICIFAVALSGCVSTGLTGKLEKTGGPPPIPPPKQVTSAERTAGTETALRSFAPSDIASMAGTHGGSAEAGAFDFTTWDANTNAGTKDAIRDQFVIYDTDGDGDIDNIDGAVGGGDITGVGPGGTSAGDALTDGYVTSGTTMFVWEGTTDDTNEYFVTVPSADPAGDLTWTFPSVTGTLLTADGPGTALTALNGENIQDDTIDDDSLDFFDITLDDFVSAEGDYISVAVDDTFDFTREDSGIVTLTASDDDATAALTILPGGAAALVLGGASTTTITATTDGGSVLLDGLVAIGTDPADTGVIRLENATAIAWEDATETTLTHVDNTGLSINTGLAVGGTFDANGVVALGDGGDNFSIASDGIDIDTSGNITNAGTIGSGAITSTGAVTGATVTDGTITLAGDGTITGLAEGGIPNSTIVTADIKDNDLTASDLSATLTFSDGDLINLSGITHTADTNEGLILPTWANVTTTGLTNGAIAWDETTDAIKVKSAAGWQSIGASAAPTDAQYLTLALDATLSAERVLTEGTDGIDFTDTGANGALTITFDATEVGTETWGSGSGITWTFNASGGTDTTIAFGDGAITASVFTSTGLLTATGGTTLGTGTHLTVGAVQWDNGSDYIDGEKIANDTIDDDSIDFADVTLADLTFDVGSVDTTEFGYLNGVTSSIQNQLDARCLESVFGTAIEADDLALNGTTLELVAEIPHIDAAQNISADWEWQDGIPISFGNGNDWEVAYDDTTDDRLEFTHTAGAGADVIFDLNDNAADSTFTITNSDGTYEANGVIEGDLDVGGALTAASITADASSSPGWAAADSDADAVGTFTFSIDAYTAGYDSQIIFKVDDSSGEDQTYATYDGSLEQVTFAKPVVASSTMKSTGTFTVGATGTISEETNTMTFDDGDGDPITLQEIRTMVAGAEDNNLEVDGAAGIANTEIFVGNGAGVGTYVSMNGEAAMSNTGGVTLADSVTVTGWVLGTSSATQLTVGALAGVNSIDATGAVDIDVGSGDITDVTVTTDGGTVILDGSVTASSTITSSGTYDVTGATSLTLGSADVTAWIFSGISETLTLTPSADLITATSGTGVATFDFGTINLATDALDVSDGNITNVGNIAIDSITADGTNVLFGSGAATQLQFRDTALHIASLDDGHLDLTADTSIDLNGAVVTSSTLNVGTDLTVTGSDIDVGVAGVRLTGDGDGAITLLGLGDGSDENLTINLDDTANTIVLSSSTGVTEMDFSAFRLVTDGVILGAVNVKKYTAASYTNGTDDSDEVRGTYHVNSDDDAFALTLTAGSAGDCGCLSNGQGVTAAISLIPPAGDYLVQDGVRGTAATALASSGASGDKICWLRVDADDIEITSYHGTWAE